MLWNGLGYWGLSEMDNFRSVCWRDVWVQAGAKSPQSTSSFRRCCGQSCKNQLCRWVKFNPDPDAECHESCRIIQNSDHMKYWNYSHRAKAELKCILCENYLTFCNQVTDVDQALRQASWDFWLSQNWHQAVEQSRQNQTTEKLPMVLRWGKTKQGQYCESLDQIIKSLNTNNSSGHRPAKQSACDPFHLQLYSADQAGGWRCQEGGESQRWGESW